MPAAADLIDRARAAGVELWAEGGRLKFRTSAGPLPPELRAALADDRAAVVAALSRQAAEPPPLAGAPWRAAEERAFDETARELRQAIDRGEPGEQDCSRPPRGPLIADRDVAGLIDRSERTTGAVTRPSHEDRGPRDARRGDKWLDWHFRKGENA